VMDGLVQRACIALPLAARGINEEAAQVLLRQLQQANNAIGLLQKPEHRDAWLEALEQCTRGQAHPLIAGRAVRILLEQQHWQVAQVAQALSLACTNPIQPLSSAEWLEGFLQGSGLLLVMNEQLWQILQSWVASLSGETFMELLPLLRRTFATFEAAERRQLGQRVATGTVALAPAVASAGTDEARASLVLPVLAALLGPVETSEVAA
jgi:hypothetical protein